jgi:type I restriction enzyme S subunit
MNRAAGTETLLEQSERLEVQPSTRSWQPYPEYRESGVPLLDRVPRHWAVERLKFIARTQFSNVDKKSEEGERPIRLCNYVDVYYHDRITAHLEFMEATAEPREAVKFQLQPGDVLVTKDSEDPNDICVPAVVAEPLPGVLCGYHLAQVRPHAGRIHGPYLAYAFGSSGIRDQFRMRANGITRFGLSQDDICSALFPVPPLTEQRAIAAFLDRKTRQIDELIEKKRRLIDLLQEKRTALISHAVTKGLNPDAPMKPSGIDGVGALPAHWEAKRLKYAVNLINEKVEEPGDLPYVGLEHIESWTGRRIESAEPVQPEGIANLFRPGDVLFGKLRPYLAKALHAAETGACTSEALVMRPRLVAPEFLLYYVLSPAFVSIVDGSTYGSKMPRANWEFIGNLPCLLPPVPEQRVIAAFLERQTGHIDSVIASIGRAMDMLNKYRQALISAAVTGKIDVREETGRG